MKLREHYVYGHWTTARGAEGWRWPNFSPQELASKSDGELMLDFDALDKLQALRNALGRPLIITSAYRSVAHNNKVGGAKGSEHLKARAFDVIMTNQDPVEFEAVARAVGFTGFGYYPSQRFMHIDTGDPREWGTPFKNTEQGHGVLSAEPPKTRLAEVATAIGGSGTVVSGTIAALSGLSETAQLAILVVMGLVAVGLILVMRKKLRDYFDAG